MGELEETHVVTCFLRNAGEVLLLRRSDEVGSYAGLWGGVAGHAEGDPDAAAREEIDEETGLLDHVTLVRAGEPFPVEDADLGTRWVVHPYLFDSEGERSEPSDDRAGVKRHANREGERSEPSDRASGDAANSEARRASENASGEERLASRDVETDWETTEAEWVHPTEILRRETVPELWTSYERVAPTVETVAGDREHGSAYVSVRALEVLRDRAGVLAAADRNDPDANGWDELVALATELCDARPSMAALENRVNRVMHRAAADRTPEAVEAAARRGIERAVEADDEAAANAAELVAGERVFTLSRSGTVRAALVRADPAPSVVVAESRPGREGVGVAESLAAADLDVTLCADAAVAQVLGDEGVTAVLVGADTVLPDGRVVNKVGTRVTALAAAFEGVPVYAVAAVDKIGTDGEADLEPGDPEAIYDGDADLDVANPTFDVTPAPLVEGVVTEVGTLSAEEVAEVAAELGTLADWRNSRDSDPATE